MFSETRGPSPVPLGATGFGGSRWSLASPPAHNWYQQRCPAPPAPSFPFLLHLNPSCDLHPLGAAEGSSQSGRRSPTEPLPSLTKRHLLGKVSRSLAAERRDRSAPSSSCPQGPLISALTPSVSESHTAAAQNVTGAAAKDARGPRWCPRCHINPRFKGMERGGTTVTANSPSSRLFTRLKCAKSRFCSRGLCREHPTAFQRRARWAVISQSPPCWLRSFSIEANEKKNSQKEKNNPSRRLQSESSSGNAESFWKSPPPPKSVQEWGQDGLLVAPMATARRHVGSIQTPVSYVQNHGVVCSHTPFCLWWWNNAPCIETVPFF